MGSRARRTFRYFLLSALALFIIAGATLLIISRYKSWRQPEPTKVGWQAVVRTLAGDGAPGRTDAAVSVQAQFADPFGVAFDARSGNVYVADAGESNSIRVVTKEGAVRTLAGGGREGFADGAGAAAAFHTPSGIAVDAAGSNIYVADTGNNRIRQITPDGMVTTLAGDGGVGYRDGPAVAAQFDGPLGVAVDHAGNVYVADTYNDRVRVIGTDGQVRTLAGIGGAGYADGDALLAARFDTPSAVVVAPNNELIVADTGNRLLRKVSNNDGQVSTIELTDAGEGGVRVSLSAPVGLAVTHDGFIYVTEGGGAGRVWQVTPEDGRAYRLAGGSAGFADGDGRDAARFNQPVGVAVGTSGSLLVADGANYLVRQLVPTTESVGETSPPSPPPALLPPTTGAVVPRLSAEIVGVEKDFPWPVAPQARRHEVVATLGEVRGSYDGESRHHLHSGIDVQAAYGATVLAVHEEKVTSPVSNWGFGGLNEGLRVGLFSYIHLKVGRDQKDEPLEGDQFSAAAVRDGEGKIARVRVRRGTRFRVGDALGTVNRMYHVHLNFGPPGAETNPLVLPFAGFGDSIAPRIERGGVQLYEQSGARLTQARGGNLILRRGGGPLRIVVDAYDQVDGNSARRRLGLYRLGYQLLRANGTTPAPGFDAPQFSILFDRLPPSDSDAVKIAYANESGITVYGSTATRFLYEGTNVVRGGEARVAWWDVSLVPPGEYVLRVFAADLAGNFAAENRDVPLIIE